MVISHKNFALTLNNASEEEGELNWESEVRRAAVHADCREVFVKESDREGRGRSRDGVEGFGG